MNQISSKTLITATTSVSALICLFLNIASLFGSLIIVALSISSVTYIGRENWGYFGIVCFGLPILVVQLIVFLVGTKIARVKDGTWTISMKSVNRVVRLLPLIVSAICLVLAFLFTTAF